MAENSSVIRQAEREKIIIRTSVIGIVTNVVLAFFKAGMGLISHSVAMVLDAVNNLSDALSSVVTIIGTKLAGRKPDRNHPLGHGRIEYLSALIVSAIVLYAGITSLTTSIEDLIHPEKAEYSTMALAVMGVAIVAKLILGRYVKKQGERIRSGALTASGSDALFDAMISVSVLLSALIFIATGVSLEAWVGVLISVVIIKAGYEMISKTLDHILGRRADPELAKRIKLLITEEPEIRGAYDLVINDYGPNRQIASVHIELPDTMRVDEVDVLTRRVEEKVYRETGVILTGVGVYSFNTTDDEAARIRNQVQKLVMSHGFALQMHGFFVDTKQKLMRFDVVLSFDIPADEAIKIISREVQEAFPDYHLLIAPDLDLTD